MNNYPHLLRIISRVRYGISYNGELLGVFNTIYHNRPVISVIRNNLLHLPNRPFSFTSVNEASANLRRNRAANPVNDRTKPVSLDVSIRYLKSEAYKETYGDQPVWVQYRRNFKGSYLPKKTRKMCIRNGFISTGNPCPICRDEYLVVDYRNTELIKQFVSPHNGELISFNTTGVCQKIHEKLDIAIMQAKDVGLIVFDLPFHEYDYSDFYSFE